jgi:hypothetical protein
MGLSRLRNLKPQNLKCARVAGIYPRTTNVKFLHADFSILKLDENLQLLATSTLVRQLCGTLRSELCERA